MCARRRRFGKELGEEGVQGGERPGIGHETGHLDHPCEAAPGVLEHCGKVGKCLACLRLEGITGHPAGLEAAAGKGTSLASAVGEMLNTHTVAELALADMVRINGEYGFRPGQAITSAILTRKALATEAVQRTVELAGELVGGAGLIKGHPVERIVRDVRAMHFHPLPARRQRGFAGRVALGLDPAT